MSDPIPPSPPFISLRPSRIDALKATVAGPSGTLLAIITAISGIIAVIQTYQKTEQTARVSYDTLKTASETNRVEIELCRKSQLDLKAWVKELSERVERRQETTEKIIKKVPRTTPVIPTEPVPEPPATLVIPERSALPAFDTLK